jgi:ribosomal protein L2
MLSSSRSRAAKMVRSAGAYAQLVGRDAGYAQVRLMSGELRMVHQDCMATVGAVSNPDHLNTNLGPSRPQAPPRQAPGGSRCRAMNPVDHPHGGGEGRKSSGGRHPVTPWGKKTKGRKTRSRTRPRIVDHSLAPRAQETLTGRLRHASFCLERSVCRRIPAEESRGCS